jgi:hypothetical protein
VAKSNASRVMWPTEEEMFTPGEADGARRGHLPGGEGGAVSGAGQGEGSDEQEIRLERAVKEETPAGRIAASSGLGWSSLHKRGSPTASFDGDPRPVVCGCGCGFQGV